MKHGAGAGHYTFGPPKGAKGHDIVIHHLTFPLRATVL